MTIEMLNNKKVEELRALCKVAGIKNYSSMRKDQMISLLTSSSDDVAAVEELEPEVQIEVPVGVNLTFTKSRGKATALVEKSGKFVKVCDPFPAGGIPRFIANMAKESAVDSSKILPYPVSAHPRRTIEDVAKELISEGEVRIRKDLLQRMLTKANLTTDDVEFKMADGPFFLVRTKG